MTLGPFKNSGAGALLLEIDTSSQNVWSFFWYGLKSSKSSIVIQLIQMFSQSGLFHLYTAT